MLIHVETILIPGPSCSKAIYNPIHQINHCPVNRCSQANHAIHWIVLCTLRTTRACISALLSSYLLTKCTKYSCFYTYISYDHGLVKLFIVVHRNIHRPYTVLTELVVPKHYTTEETLVILQMTLFSPLLWNRPCAELILFDVSFQTLKTSHLTRFTSPGDLRDKRQSESKNSFRILGTSSSLQSFTFKFSPIAPRIMADRSDKHKGQQIEKTSFTY